jgi:hypothetical protein
VALKRTGMPPVVKQMEMQDVVDKKALVDGLRRDLQAAEVELAKSEETILRKLETGALMEAGALTAEAVTQQQVRPAWKQECLKALGLAFVEATIAKTAPTVSKKLVVKPTPR